MYEALATLAGRLGAPHARRLAAVSLRMLGGMGAARPPAALHRRVMGLSFPSPLGLAAGFDKRGTLFPALPGLGFGFAEIGSVTPAPETGRSPGLAAVSSRLARYRAAHPIPLGVSISMNRATPPGRMPQDYLGCLAGVWEYADYITLNLGVRAGPDLHRPELRAVLYQVLAAAKHAQTRLAAASGCRRPIAVKLDQARGNTEALLEIVCDFGFEAVVLSGQTQGSSGLALLERLAGAVPGKMPLIAVGGIRTPQDALDRLNAGAALLQLYTGLVESGPGLVSRINRGIAGAHRSANHWRYPG